MSDIVKRLRDRKFFARTGERHELLAAADHIEALEAALREIDTIAVRKKVGAASKMQQVARAALNKDVTHDSRQTLLF